MLCLWIITYRCHIPFWVRLNLYFQRQFQLLLFNYQIQLFNLNQIVFPLKMAQTQTITKKNALMELFYKRPAQTLPQPKLTKKIKPNQQKQDDPLYKILSWRDQYKQYNYPSPNTYKIVKEKSIVDANQQNWTAGAQGILVNINWQTTSFNQFKNLNFTQQLINNGIVFIWGSKTNIGPMMDYFQQMNFFYVENFTFVLLDRKKIPQKSLKKANSNTSLLSFFSKKPNENHAQKENMNNLNLVQNDYQIGKVAKATEVFISKQSEFFKQSQKVLYMFRKLNKKEPLQLRHQRTSDAFFTIGDSTNLDWKSKEIVYKMIETLLINANYKEKQGLKLVELWGQSEKPRKGWITVCQEVKNTQKSVSDQTQELCNFKGAKLP